MINAITELWCAFLCWCMDRCEPLSLAARFWLRVAELTTPENY